MKVQRISAILLTSVAFSAGFIGCGDDDEGGSGGGSATSTTSSTTTSSSSNMVVSTGTTPSEVEYLGTQCTDDADCGPDGLCVLESEPEGGPSGGYCTTTCADDGDCEGEGSACLEGICYLGCILGEPPAETLDAELDPLKCHGRDELRCEEIEPGLAVCTPNCGSDSQCPGRVCDPRSNLCVDTPNPGLPMGAACDAEAAEDPCAGWCVGFGEEVTACTEFCGFGGDVVEGDCGGLQNGICLYGFAQEIGAGDLGACTKACTAHSDCLLPNARCVPIGGLPTNGFCIFESEPCEDNDDCKAPDECTETPDGFFCLNPKYPLSGEGTGGAGGAGGAGGGDTGGGGTGGDGGAGGATTTTTTTTSASTTAGAGGAGGAGGATTTAGAGGAGGATTTAGAGGAGGA
ncbi:hypothetical protein WME91_28475 [Sorangium sp. So ce269]